jgi:RimJ/RimL family protein N-acetyltransferase
MTTPDTLNTPNHHALPQATLLESYKPADGAEPYPERSHWLESRLDPQHTLPMISYAEDPSALTEDILPDEPYEPALNERGYRIYGKDGEPVGKFILGTDANPDNPAETVEHIRWINVAEDKQNQGYGKATYLALLKTLPNSATLVSDNSLSDDSMRLWRWLESHGIATQQSDAVHLTDRYVKSSDDTAIFTSDVDKPDPERAPVVEVALPRRRRFGRAILTRLGF